MFGRKVFVVVFTYELVLGVVTQVERKAWKTEPLLGSIPLEWDTFQEFLCYDLLDPTSMTIQQQCFPQPGPERHLSYDSNLIGRDRAFNAGGGAESRTARIVQVEKAPPVPSYLMSSLATRLTQVAKDDRSGSYSQKQPEQVVGPYFSDIIYEKQAAPRFSGDLFTGPPRLKHFPLKPPHYFADGIHERPDPDAHHFPYGAHSEHYSSYHSEHYPNPFIGPHSPYPYPEHFPEHPHSKPYFDHHHFRTADVKDASAFEDNRKEFQINDYGYNLSPTHSHDSRYNDGSLYPLKNIESPKPSDPYPYSQVLASLNDAKPILMPVATVDSRQTDSELETPSKITYSTKIPVQDDSISPNLKFFPVYNIRCKLEPVDDKSEESNGEESPSSQVYQPKAAPNTKSLETVITKQKRDSYENKISSQEFMKKLQQIHEKLEEMNK